MINHGGRSVNAAGRRRSRSNREPRQQQKRQHHRSAALLATIVSLSATATATVLLASLRSSMILPRADALFLMTSSHHQRRPPPSSSSRARGGGAGNHIHHQRHPRSGPKAESKTKRRPTESRSSSPLIVFYGMIFDRPRTHGEEQREGKDTDGSDNNSIDDNSNNEDEEDSFSKDMIERKQEFRQRYENFRGRGRWGGYSLQAIPHQNQIQRPPLPVVSTTKPSSSTSSPRTTTATTTTTQSKPSTPTALASSPTKSLEQRRQNNRRGGRPSPMLQITDIQQYKDEVVDSNDSSMVVVRFYASWCKACKAIESCYHRLPQEFSSSSVKFVEVPLTKENAFLHKGLEIPSLPFAHVYHSDDWEDLQQRQQQQRIRKDDGSEAVSSSSKTLVEEVKINKSKFPEFKRIIRSYVDRECDVYYSKGGNGGDGDEYDETAIDVVVATPPSHRDQQQKAAARAGGGVAAKVTNPEAAAPMA
mmetsp:Transcript_10671/g.22523  ORF Transcript_10671/g.22523 Transcript_10671/m.22523 type:complete len:476 (-) Transcript_10671:641-2068(-)